MKNPRNDGRFELDLNEMNEVDWWRPTTLWLLMESNQRCPYLMNDPRLTHFYWHIVPRFLHLMMIWLFIIRHENESHRISPLPAWLYCAGVVTKGWRLDRSKRFNSNSPLIDSFFYTRLFFLSLTTKDTHHFFRSLPKKMLSFIHRFLKPKKILSDLIVIKEIKKFQSRESFYKRLSFNYKKVYLIEMANEDESYYSC